MPLEFTHACSARGGFSSCVNREVGMGSHSLSHSSPAPNNPYGFCGRKAPPKKKFSSSLICGTSIPRSRGPMNTIRHARGPRCHGPMNTIRHARGPRCRGPMNTIRHARGPRYHGPMNTIRQARGPRCRDPMNTVREAAGGRQASVDSC